MPETFDDDLVPCIDVHGPVVTVRYRTIPARDITTVDGIRCTTAIRTLIDLAPSAGHGWLEKAVRDCLERRLFTVGEARARIAEPDMLHNRGARLLGEALP